MTPQEKNTEPEARAALQRTAFKAVLIAIMAGAFVVPLALVAMPYIEFFNDMAVQPRGDPQSFYGRTAGVARPVEQPPVAGTIPRGHRPYPYEGNDRATARRAGEELVNPVDATMENMRRGQAVYAIYCRTCHGEWGDGDGPVVGPERMPAPPSLTSTTVAKYPDGRIFHIITKGQERMPGYEEIIAPADRWKAVWFVSALHRALQTEAQEKKE
jgi:mono/diheme cytochrome c family protein